MTTQHNIREAGFEKLAAMVAEMGDAFTPQRFNLQELIDDTRNALQGGTQKNRPGMIG